MAEDKPHQPGDSWSCQPHHHSRPLVTGHDYHRHEAIYSAYLSSTAFSVLGAEAENRLQWNRHIWDVEPRLLVPAIQLSWVNSLLFDAGTCLTKLSMLVLIYRVTAAASSRMRFVVIGTAWFIAVGGVIFVIVTIAQCRPVQAYWDLTIDRKSCIDTATHLLAAGIVNTATDFIIVLLPVPTVMKVGLPLRQRIILSALFAGGLVVGAAGVARTYFVWFMWAAPDFDTTWHASIAVLTSTVELQLGIICVSLPATKPFFRLYVPRLLGNSPWGYDSSSKNDKRTSSDNTQMSHRPFGDPGGRDMRPLNPQDVRPLYPDNPRHARSDSLVAPNLDKPLPPIRQLETEPRERV